MYIHKERYLSERLNREQILAPVHAYGVTLYRDLRDKHCSTGEASACQRVFLAQGSDVFFTL